MRPAEIYRWVNGDTVWTQTSADAEITHGGETYDPVPIGRSDIDQTQEMARNNITVNTARSNPVALLHLTEFPETTTTLTISRYDAGDVTVLWKGRIASAESNGNEITVACEPIFTSLTRYGLRARYQRSCRHALYRRGCNVNGSNEQEDHGVDGGAASTDGRSVEVAVAAERANGRYTGGMLRFDDTYRLITRHAGTTLTMQQSIGALDEAVDSAGWDKAWGQHWDGLVAVRIYPGCKHNMVDCGDEFDNLDNYGGFPWVPGKNPFGGSSIV